MSDILAFLRGFNFCSVVLRLIMALFFGGMIGMERGSRHKAAGFRTYMLVCLGATLTMLWANINPKCWMHIGLRAFI